MKTFFESLLQSNPEISEDSASQFRSGLTVVSNQLHEENDQAMQRSLLNWAEWLNDNGYDSNSLLTILSHVAEATIGKAAKPGLDTYIQSNATKPLGLPHLVEHLQASYPELAKAIEELEAQAVEEESELASMAGGMSKQGKVGLIATASIVGLGITGGLVYKKTITWMLEKAEAALEKADRDAEAAKDILHTELATKAIKNDYKKEFSNLLEDLRLDYKNEPSDRKTRGLFKVMLARIREGRENIVPQVKSLEKYVVQDIEIHAEELALRHVKEFTTSLESKAITLFKAELKELEINLKDDYGFRDQVKKKLKQSGEDIDNLIWTDIQKLSKYKQVEGIQKLIKYKQVENSILESQLKDYVRLNFGQRDLMRGYQEIKDSYAAQLREEINSALKTKERKLENKVVQSLEDDEMSFDESEELKIRAQTKLDADIVQKTEVLRSAAKRDATAAAQDAVKEGRAAERGTERFL